MARLNLHLIMMTIKRLVTLKFVWPIVIVLICAVYFCIPPKFPSIQKVTSLKITDRNGVLLREVFSPSSGRGTPLRLDEISPEYIKVLIASEDSRFYSHHGIDPAAIIRAIKDNYHSKKITSGASTITQQLAKNIYHFNNRNIFTKIIEALEAVRIDLHYSKKQILEQYCNRISFGNNNFGIEAASQFYFGKSARNLTLSESAYLVTIPKNPTQNNPLGKGLLSAGLRYRSTLNKLLSKGVIDSTEYQISMNNYPLIKVHNDYIKAPHFTNFILSQLNPDSLEEIKTTLDYSVQREAESILSQWVESCLPYHVTNASAIVIKNSSNEIIAYIGSKDFWDEEHQGQVDGIRSLRQPGSAIKPFTYALALTKNYTASTVIPDIPTHLPTEGGDFKPLNYDKTFHGPVRLRVALGCSYNIPAIRVAYSLGAENLLDFYHECGFNSLKKSAAEYGLGLTLGNGEVTAYELARGASMFAKHGLWGSLKSYLSYKTGNNCYYNKIDSSNQVISEQVAFLISNILADHDARAPAFGSNSALDLPFRCSVKTGTTKDYKDNWTIGWTDSFTVAVWAGNFDGSPMQNVSGVSGAAPIFHEIMYALSKRYTVNNATAYVPPKIIKTKVCVISGEKAGLFCPDAIEEYFIEGKLPSSECTYHSVSGLHYPPIYASWNSTNGETQSQGFNDEPLRILFPDDGDIFKIDPDLDRNYQTIQIKAQVPSSINNIGIAIDGKSVDTVTFPFSYRWKIMEGSHRIRIFDTKDLRRNDEVAVRIEP